MTTSTKKSHPPRLLGLAAVAAAAAVLGLTACNRADDATVTGDAQTQPSDPGMASNMPPTTDGPATTAPESGGDTGVATAPTTSPEGMVTTDPTGAGVPPASGGAQAALTAMETDFMKTAAASGQYEVELARLAAEKATDPAIKSYAGMLVEHHTGVNDQLRQMAVNANVPLPSGVPTAKQQNLDKLSQASGKEFDKQFVQTITRDHKEDIALFERATRDAKNSEVRSFAQATLPTLQAHLTVAERLPIGATR
jgi:putative membrane protein